MSGETEDDVSGWTVDTLHAHTERVISNLIRMLDERYATQTKAVDAAFSAAEIARQTARLEDKANVATALANQEKAVSKAEVATEKRFDAVNEFRQAFADLVRKQMPRAEADARLNSLSEKIDELRQAHRQDMGRSAGIDKAWGWLVGAVGIVAAAVAIIGTR